MMIEEFEQRTGIYPDRVLYQAIEKEYIESDLDKDDFCKAYKKNTNGLAVRLQWNVNMAHIDAECANAAKIDQLTQEIDRLKKELERAQGWRPYEDSSNVKQADYERLAHSAMGGNSAHYMTDEEAVAWICDEFDFDPAKVTILHEIDEYEVNNQRQLRKTGKKIDRRPIYDATDYYYIRFNTNRWYYECWNGECKPYYC